MRCADYRAGHSSRRAQREGDRAGLQRGWPVAREGGTDDKSSSGTPARRNKSCWRCLRRQVFGGAGLQSGWPVAGLRLSSGASSGTPRHGSWPKNWRARSTQMGDREISSVAFNPDGSLLATATHYSPQVAIYDTATWEEEPGWAEAMKAEPGTKGAMWRLSARMASGSPRAAMA